MAMKMKNANRKLQAWIDARTRHHLTHAQIQMARELGMNPAKLGKLDNHHQESWKLPLPEFIEELYRKRFGKTVPDTVISIEDRLRRDREKKQARRTARQQPITEVKQGRDQRWIDGRDFRLADEVRYMQRRAAERSGRIVTIGPLLLFSTDSGDAWILDPADHLATRIAKDGVSTPVHIEETDTSFAVGWQGGYEISGAAFIFADTESGRVTTILGYPTQRIVDQISSVYSNDGDQ
jgi:hypothetical protein